jgi:Domain of unknown function (DUF4203)
MFQQLCVGLFAVLFGLALLFAGYRFFLLLIPFWGFFAGFAIGAAAVTALFGDQFLATITGWVAGFILGIGFAIFSYFFYIIGIAILSGSIGYAIGSTLVFPLLPNADLLALIIGLVTAIIIAGITLGFNLQRWAIILLTSIGGASTLVAGVLVIFGGIDVADFVGDAITPTLTHSYIWLVVWIVLAVVGVLSQAGSTRNYTLGVPQKRRAF